MADTANLSKSPTKTLSPKERAAALGLALGLGGILAYSFIPTANALIRSLGFTGPWMSRLAFPIVALVFHFSIPQKKDSQLPTPDWNPWKISVLPILIALIFGWLRPGNLLLTFASNPAAWYPVVWYLIAVPLGEELLFRGWLYQLSERIWPRSYLTESNPLPTSLWVSAIAFSLWHLQNAAQDPMGFVLFQATYTLVVGLWLGFLRWRTGNLLAPLAGHIAINLAASAL